METPSWGRGRQFECPMPPYSFNMDRPCQFMVLNKGLTHAAVVARKTILASPVVEVANAVVPSGERFYDVPATVVEIINLMAGH